MPNKKSRFVGWLKPAAKMSWGIIKTTANIICEGGEKLYHIVKHPLDAISILAFITSSVLSSTRWPLGTVFVTGLSFWIFASLNHSNLQVSLAGMSERQRSLDTIEKSLDKKSPAQGQLKAMWYQMLNSFLHAPNLTIFLLTIVFLLGYLGFGLWGAITGDSSAEILWSISAGLASGLPGIGYKIHSELIQKLARDLENKLDRKRIELLAPANNAGEEGQEKMITFGELLVEKSKESRLLSEELQQTQARLEAAEAQIIDKNNKIDSLTVELKKALARIEGSEAKTEHEEVSHGL